MFFQIVFFTHIILCVALVGLVLVQQGKGAELGASLSGGADSVFGAGGAADMITKVTTALAIAFMITSVFLVRHYNEVSYSKRQNQGDPLTGSLYEEDAKTSSSATSPVTTKSATTDTERAAVTTTDEDKGEVEQKEPIVNSVEEENSNTVIEADLEQEETKPVKSE